MREAIARVREAISPHGSFSNFTAEPVAYQMYLGFPESEVEAIQAAADELRGGDPRISSIITKEPRDGNAELLLELPATDRDDAATQAVELYRTLRAQAGLEPAEPLYGYLGLTGPLPTEVPEPPERHSELADRARWFFERGSTTTQSSRRRRAAR